MRKNSLQQISKTVWHRWQLAIPSARIYTRGGLVAILFPSVIFADAAPRENWRVYPSPAALAFFSVPPP
jgi:hypothetical protein